MNEQRNLTFSVEGLPPAPSFEHAPEWAKFVGLDADGQWTWFEAEPGAAKDWFYPQPGTRWAVVEFVNWRDSLRERP